MNILEKEQKLRELLAAQSILLTDEESAALHKCFGKRGKYKGYLTRNAPSSYKEPLANVIYNAITPNGYKMQICNIMCMRKEHKETYNKLSEFNYPDWLDLDKETLVKLRVW